MKRIPGVVDAKVNFAAAKITVWGEVRREAVEEAGAFESLKLMEEQATFTDQKVPIWKRPTFYQVVGSGLSLILGWWTLLTDVEEICPTFFFVFTIILGGYALIWRGLTNLTRLRFDMSTLMTVAILGAGALGEWGEGATLVFLFAISEWLERISMDQARSSLRNLLELVPPVAQVIQGDGVIATPVAEVHPGARLLVRPGEQIPLDGIVVKGLSAVNQAAITGEAVPEQKQPGDPVYAGTLNGDGLLEVEVTKEAEESTLAQVIQLVEEAQEKKAPAQQLVDRFARYYTPLIIAIAGAVAILPPLLVGQDWQAWIYRGLAILVVGCPCALVISTPVAIVTAVGNAARNGVLIKGGAYLEEVGRLTTIAFDKTGTLTQGKPQITDVIPLAAGVGGSDLLLLAHQLEEGSNHPLATAIHQAVEDGKLKGSPQRELMEEFRNLPGKGITATIAGKSYRLGQSNWLLYEEKVQYTPAVEEWIERLEQAGKTVMLLADEGQILGVLAARDELRPEIPHVVRVLKELGLKHTVMLTGDHQQTAVTLGAEAGIDQVQAQLLPEEKLRYIEELAQQERVAMVGDGINDAPALARAHVGIAMGGIGTAAAMESAQIILMADDLQKLPFTVRLSRRTLRIIRENITVALGLKLFALILIIPGWLTLWMAIFADMGATLLVTLNALRLLRVKNHEVCRTAE